MWCDWLRNIVEFEISLATGLGGLGLALGVFLLSQAVLVVVLVALPADFFCRPARGTSATGGMAALRWFAKIAKNAAGAIVILLGLPLALPGIPGPGLVLILVGIALLDFPGKRQLQYRLISRPRVLRSINSLRSRFGRPEMIVRPSANRLADAADED